MTSEEGAGRGVETGALLDEVPTALDAELVETLLKANSVRIERIVSTGHVTAPGCWCDQGWDEWVALIAGTAEVLIEGERAPRRLETGDWLFLPARVRHRVAATADDRPTVWLAVHIAVPEDAD